MLQLNDEVLNDLNNSLEEQSEEHLSLGVYPMQIAKISNVDADGQRFIDRNGEAYLKVAIKTGFKKQDGANRYFVQNFHLQGQYPDGTLKIQALARFLKRCFRLDKVTTDNLNAIGGRKIAVATKKDKEGYITFWYAGHIDELDELKKTYKAKDESNGQRPKRNQATHEPDPYSLSEYEDLPF